MIKELIKRDGWKTVRLGDVCETTSGGTPSRSKKEYWNGKIPWIKSGAMNFKEINEAEEFITELGLKNSSAKFFEKNTVVMAMYGATAGKTSILRIKATTNQAVCGIIPKDEKILDTHYLLFLLKSMEKFFVSRAHGGGQPNISQSIIRDAEIPIPSLPVQKQIVSILEKAENLKQKRNETNKETQKIIQSLFYEMFGDPVKNEKGWDVKTISEIGEVISGSTPKTSNKEYWNGEVNWITPAELIDGDNYYYYKTERKISYAGLKSIGNRLFPVGTVMLTTRAPIGKVAIAGSEMCSNQGFKNIICNDKLIHPVYLYVLLLTRKDYLNSIGTGATFKEISKKTVETVSLSVPPFPLQEEFAKKVQLIESIQSKQQSSTEEINTLFDALMQKAFKGELVE